MITLRARTAAAARLQKMASGRGYARSLSSAATVEHIDEDDNVEPQKHPLYPTLFSSLDLGPAGILPNRVLMGSMHTGLEGHSMPGWFVRNVLGSDDAHQELDRMAAYFQERALGGVGLMVTGGVAPNWQGWVGLGASKLTTQAEMERHKVVTRAVHEVQVPIYGAEDQSVPSRIVMQVLHTGRYAYHPFPVSASATKSPISPFKARELSTSQVQQTVKDFARSAQLAQQAGYDGVEIMGSEGYLLSQFLSPSTNKRKDVYGGPSIKDRARLPLEIVKAVRVATGNDPKFLVIFRISLLDLVENGGGMTWEEVLELAVLLEESGVSILNTGIGWHESRVPTIATSVPRGAFGFSTKSLKESGIVSIPLVSTNRINAPDTAEILLAGDNGKWETHSSFREMYDAPTSDLVSMARPLLADPDFLNKAWDQQADAINTCIACNQACLDHAFVGKTASCLVNPRACHETELPKIIGNGRSKASKSFNTHITQLPESQRLAISVVGAGPAGCAFAIAAADMGHQVTLYDKGDRIGGQFHMAKRVPGKEEFHETLRYFDRRITSNPNITLRLGTQISHSDMTSEDVDKWVIATGVEPRIPDIPGAKDHPSVLSYIDVLKHDAPVGQKVAIIGAGGIGFDVAEFLLHHDGVQDRKHSDVSVNEFWDEWGIDPQQHSRGGLKKPSNSQPKEPRRQIHLLQRKKGKVGATLGRTTGWIHRATLKAGNVNMVNGVSYDLVDENGHLHITNKDGSKQILEVDNIILCAGQIEQRELANGSGSNVYTIGGAEQAGELDAKRAIDMGTRLALRIHEPDVVPGKHVFSSTAGPEEKLFTMMKRFM